MKAHHKKIFIVAGEESSDAHGAALVRQLKKRRPTLRISGYGGKRMAAAGMKVLYDLPRLAVVGFSEVIKHLPLFWRLERRVLRALDKGVDLLVLLDYPGMNLRLAKAARRRGIKVVYYISPQLWAWRPSRVKIIKECVAKMLVIFPFEVDFYRKHGVKAVFVGHPLLEEPSQRLSRTVLIKRYAVEKNAKLIGLLPGSRRSEIRRLLRPMLETGKLLTLRGGKYTFFLPLGSNIARREVEREIRRCGLTVKIITAGERNEVRPHFDLALVASGTAALETGLYGTPMLILYKTSPINYLLAKWLVKGVRHMGMINILAGKRLVPEYLQNEVDAEKIARAADKILKSSQRRAEMRRGFAVARRKLGKYKASARVAGEIVELL